MNMFVHGEFYERNAGCMQAACIRSVNPEATAATRIRIKAESILRLVGILYADRLLY